MGLLLGRVVLEVASFSCFDVRAVIFKSVFTVRVSYFFIKIKNLSADIVKGERECRQVHSILAYTCQI